MILEKKLDRNKAVLYFLLGLNLVLVILLSMISNSIQLDLDSINNNIRANLITLNTFFAGFLYNLLGTLIEFTTRPELKGLRVNGYLDKYFNAIYISIIAFVSSIILGIFPVFLNLFTHNLLLYMFELWFMLNGLALFLYSLFKFKKLINLVKNKS